MPKVAIDQSSLLSFLKYLSQHSDAIDELMKQPESTERGKLIAAEMNKFDYRLDSFIAFDCGIHFNDVKKVNDKTFKLNCPLLKKSNIKGPDNEQLYLIIPKKNVYVSNKKKWVK